MELSCSSPPLHYRHVVAGDLSELKALHAALFPIDYEDCFFQKVINNEDRIFSFAAVQPRSSLHLQQQQQQQQLDWQQQWQQEQGQQQHLLQQQYGGTYGQQQQQRYRQPPQQYQLSHPLSKLAEREAPQQQQDRGEEVVGFITARVVNVRECDPVDRHYMGVASHSMDGQTAVYILTLGVAPGHRKRGIAMHLLQLAHQQANAMGCRLMFLHVITYNAGALRLYTRAGFACAGQLRNFYYINSGRQPDPSRQHYDALLYMLPLGAAVQAVQPPAALGFWPFASCWGASARHVGQPDPGLWLGPLAWGVSAAAAPIRHALGSFEACFPWHRGPPATSHHHFMSSTTRTEAYDATSGHSMSSSGRREEDAALRGANGVAAPSTWDLGGPAAGPAAAAAPQSGTSATLLQHLFRP